MRKIAEREPRLEIRFFNGRPYETSPPGGVKVKRRVSMRSQSDVVLTPAERLQEGKRLRADSQSGWAARLAWGSTYSWCGFVWD